jgi:hypothetical protein
MVADKLEPLPLWRWSGIGMLPSLWTGFALSSSLKYLHSEYFSCISYWMHHWSETGYTIEPSTMLTYKRCLSVDLVETYGFPGAGPIC